MLTVGDKLPPFEAQALVSLDPGREFQVLTHQSYAGRWLVLFFWPMDFTFVCPTEIAGFGSHHLDFAERGAQVLGASIDSQYVHLAWREQHPGLRAIPFPMLADVKRELSQSLGILDKKEGVAMRATFLVDPTGTIRWVDVNDLSVGRSVDEVLRVLDALQTEQLTPCNWHRGDPTLHAA
jgi:peroxiredoxin (alkyl hydroperoxide reductase subunit C)